VTHCRANGRTHASDGKNNKAAIIISNGNFFLLLKAEVHDKVTEIPNTLKSGKESVLPEDRKVSNFIIYLINLKSY
jgi:hypothetical protein